MRIIIILISALFSIESLRLKKKKKLSKELSGNDQSYFTDKEILNLKNIARAYDQKSSLNPNVINLPKFYFPSDFPKKDKFFYSNKMKLPNKLKSSLHSDLKCCGIEVKDLKPKPKPKGHYEKVIKKVENYFWVSGEKPSGMPGALVVSKKEAKANLGLEI